MRKSIKDPGKAFLYAVIVDILVFILKQSLGGNMFDLILQKVFVQNWYLWIGLFIAIFMLWILRTIRDETGSLTERIKNIEKIMRNSEVK
jgi:hypothetical protein